MDKKQFIINKINIALDNAKHFLDMSNGCMDNKLSDEFKSIARHELEEAGEFYFMFWDEIEKDCFLNKEMVKALRRMNELYVNKIIYLYELLGL